MEKLYWIDGTEFVELLKNHGYKWQSGEKIGDGLATVERLLDDEHSTVIAVNHEKKTAGVVPLEIYAPGSPTADSDKFKMIADMCGDYEDLKEGCSSNA